MSVSGTTRFGIDHPVFMVSNIFCGIIGKKVPQKTLDVKRLGWICLDAKTVKAPDFSGAFGLHWTSPDC
jgi:hypothetical protein